VLLAACFFEMPGPGGPGPAAERALASRLDPRLLEQQVLVAAFPDGPPEVHVVCADQARCALMFMEAGVTDGGAVDLGSERTVPLADIGSVRADDSGMTLTLLGKDRKLLVQMHFEEAGAQLTWIQGLRLLIAGNGSDEGGSPGGQAAGGDESDEGGAEDEMHLLQARSRQLQNKIGSLEAVNERRDKQLNKMVRRLDGAMQMLSAVQDMCTQQRKVILAQKVVITEFHTDLGLEADAGSPGMQGSPKASGAAWAEAAAEAAPDPDSEDSLDGQEPADGGEGDEAVAANAEKMFELLAQAERMQQMLQMLESGGADVGSESDGSPGGLPGGMDMASSLAALMAGVGGAQGPGGSSMASSLAALMAQATENPAAFAEEVEESGDEVEEELEPEQVEAPIGEDEEAALERLQGLESEKQRFEGLLHDSQQEHQDLLEKLNSMRGLMSALGLQEEGGMAEDE